MVCCRSSTRGYARCPRSLTGLSLGFGGTCDPEADGLSRAGKLDNDLESATGARGGQRLRYPCPTLGGRNHRSACLGLALTGVHKYDRPLVRAGDIRDVMDTERHLDVLVRLAEDAWERPGVAERQLCVDGGWFKKADVAEQHMSLLSLRQTNTDQ